MEWIYGSMGWAVSARNGAFFWVITSKLGLRPCYVQPYSQTNVPVGIDGLEFV